MQHRRERAADRRGERERGERIRGVVTAAQAQRIGRHQTLQVQLFDGVVTLPRALFALVRSHEPCHAVLDDEAEVAGTLRRIETETEHLTRFRFRDA